MKFQEIFEHLKDISLKLGVKVSEENLKKNVIPVRSGFCIVNGKPVFVMDKFKTAREKVEILAAWLVKEEDVRGLSGIYMVPAVRELLNKVIAKKFEST